MPFQDFPLETIGGNLLPPTRVFDVTGAIGGAQTVTVGAPLQGPTLLLAGLNSLALWIKGTQVAGGTLTVYLLEIDPTSSASAYSTAATDILRFQPGPVALPVAAGWKRWSLDSFNINTTIVNAYCALYLVPATQNAVISDTRLYVRPAGT